MISNLPEPDKLSEIQKSNKKYGRRKTFVDQVQSNWLLIIVIIFIVFSEFRTEKKYKTLENQILNINQNTQIVSLGDGNEIQHNISDDQPEDVLGDKASSFNPEEWIIKSFEQDDEGYYCSLTKKFEVWSMWSKKKVPPNVDKIKIKVKLKNRKNKNKVPTFTISYGEYKPEFSPIVAYRLNIFDTDVKSIRLYDDKNKSVAQSFLELEPDLSSDLTIELIPRIPDPKSRVIKLNPSIVYVASDQDTPVEFEPEEEFATLLPTATLEDETPQQFGIGTNYETCFKPIFVEL